MTTIAAPRPLTRPVPPAAGTVTPLIVWLAVVAAMIAGIVIVGGITRLTESGVSITEWNVVSGTLPPLTEAAWQAEFDAYRRTPQFILVNGPAGMTLATYKWIFFWEWVHRLLARSIGTVFALPLVWFWWRGTIPAGYKPRLLALLALGGLQGAVGWWMVKSGITHDIRVSHYRLAIHLLVALTTLGGVLWTLLDLAALRRGQAPARLTRFGAVVLVLLVGQLGLGALLAGLRAGVVAGAGWFSTDAWPLMQGRLVPAGIEWHGGVWATATSDPYLVHFLHRWWAWVVVAALVVLARQLRVQGARAPSVAIHSAFGTQVLLGIMTVWSGVALPLAVLHQFVGALLVACTVWGVHRLGSPARQ